MLRVGKGYSVVAFCSMLAVVSGCADIGGDDQFVDEFDLIEGEDPEYRGGGYGLFQTLLANFVRFRAETQGIEALPDAPEVREELIELGQALAFDKELSGNRDVSCMTCHHPSLATDDNLSLSIGVGGAGLGSDRTHPHDIFIPRNAPGLFNLHDLDTMFWDGRVNVKDGVLDTPAREKLTQEMIDVFEFGAVSAQAMFPVTSRAEMRGAVGENEIARLADSDFIGIWGALMNRLGQIPEYVELFEAAYPGTDFEDMTFAHAANALAGFQIAAFEANDTPWDEMLRGDDQAMSVSALLGANHFLGKAKCSTCHAGSSLSDEQFHNTALPQFGPGKNDGVTLTDDWGRYNETDDPGDFYRFRSAPLRNVELTGPYGHAGQFTELEDFVRHYLDPATSLLNWDSTQIDPLLQETIIPTNDAVLRHLSPILEEEADFRENRVDEMMDFMAALTDPDSQELLDTIPESVPSGLPVAELEVPVEAENRYGSMTLDMELPGSLFREIQIQTPEMCDSDSQLTVNYDRNANTLVIDGTLTLPHRPTICYDYSPNTEYNSYPDCVEDGRFQLWIAPRAFNKISKFYYDGVTGDLIGSEFDVEPSELPPSAFPVDLPGVQMLCSDFFESDPETLLAEVHFEYEYDNMLDMLGSAGAIFTQLPRNIFVPDDLELYYTQGGLPASEAMSFDDFIEQNNEGRGPFMISTSYEPFPKPDYLAARDNVMIAYTGAWPKPHPEDSLFQYEPPVECGTTFQWPAPGVGMDAPPVP